MDQRQRSPRPPDFGHGPIQVRVLTVYELFNPVDPSPMEQRALDTEVADWIEEWAEELEDRGPVTLEVYVADDSAAGREEPATAGLRGHFQYREWQLDRQLRRLLREGRISLLIGVIAMSAFTAASRLIGESDYTLVQIAHDGLSVLGWVAMWKPLNIFLYEWWPVRRERRACQRLAEATVRFP